MTKEKMTENARIGYVRFMEKIGMSWEDFTKNKTYHDIFLEGFKACLSLQEEEKNLEKLNNSKKSKFDIYKFIDERNGRDFLKSVHYDATDKKVITTNGNFLVFQNVEFIPEQWQDKTVYKNKTICDCRYPEYKKVIPPAEDMDTLTDEQKNYFVKSCLESDAKLGLTMAAAAKSVDAIKINDNVALFPKMLKYIAMFLKTQDDVKIYYHKNDNPYNDKQKWNYRSWVIEGNNATMVFMPCMIDISAAKVA